MSKPLLVIKIAILVANGFCEQDMTETQRALAEAGAHPRIISTEQGLVNGWTGESWGHHFAVDAPLSSALGADYDMLVVPGGKRSHDKLKLTAHTRRFVSSFIASRKPVVVMDDAVSLLVVIDAIRGMTLSGPAGFEEQVKTAGALWSDESPCQDGALVSGAVTKDNRSAFIKALVEFFVGHAMGDGQASKAA